MPKMGRSTIRLCFFVWALMTAGALEGPDLYNLPLEGPEPEFARPIGNHTFYLGREATLTCAVRHLGSHKVRKNVGWLRAYDKTILAMHTRVITGPRYSVTVDNPHSWSLNIKPLKVEDAGCYICQLNTRPFMKWQIGCIDVYVPPDIISNESTRADVSVPEGGNATLRCDATGHPTPRITWRREDHGPILFRRPHQKEFDKVKTHPGNTISFWRVDRRQMGVFLCIASNDVPPAVSKRISLFINFAPVLEVPNQLFGAPFGTDVKLRCYIEAYPNTINYWIKNPDEIIIDGPKFDVTEEKKLYQTTMHLTIKNFEESDIGTYNCISKNSLGKSEGTLRVYQIKIAPYSEDYPYQISVAGGLSNSSGTLVIHIIVKTVVVFFIGYAVHG